MTRQVKVIEVTGVKLDPKAKYIISVSPQWGEYLDVIGDSLDRMGIEATVWPIPAHDIKVFEVMPGATQEKAE